MATGARQRPPHMPTTRKPAAPLLSLSPTTRHAKRGCEMAGPLPQVFDPNQSWAAEVEMEEREGTLVRPPSRGSLQQGWHEELEVRR